MNKTAIGMLLSCLVFIFSTSQVSAIAIDFFPSDTTVFVGESFNVDVVVSGLSASSEIVSAFDMFVGFDSNVLTATDVTYGSFLGAETFFQYTDVSIPGQVYFSDVSLLSDAELLASQPDSFTLATLSFDALVVGTSELLFNPHPFFGYQDIKGLGANVLSVTAGIGGITVLAPIITVPEPNSLSLFLLALVILSTIPLCNSYRT